MKSVDQKNTFRFSRLNRGRFLLLAVPLLLAGCHPDQPKEPAAEAQVSADTITMAGNSPQLAALTVAPVSAAPRMTVPLSGRLVWDEEVTVRVFSPFAGIIRKVSVKVGESVTAGQPLAEIQSGDFSQVRAEARKAESDGRRAERNLNRLRDLAQHGAAARKELESAEEDFAASTVEKERAAARLAIYSGAGTNDQSFLLPSPLPGIVVEKNVTPGQEVRPDQMLANAPQFTAPLVTITDPSRLWIQIDATEVDLPHLKSGSEFTFASRAFPGQTFTGKVDVVSEFLDPGTRTIKVRGTVDNSRRLLKAEMFASVTLPGEEIPGTSVPSRAVFLKGEKHYVFIEDHTGQFSRHEVKIGPEKDGQVLVLAGIQPGQRVVTDGCVLLQQVLHD